MIHAVSKRVICTRLGHKGRHQDISRCLPTTQHCLLPAAYFLFSSFAAGFSEDFSSGTTDSGSRATDSSALGSLPSLGAWAGSFGVTSSGVDAPGTSPSGTIRSAGNIALAERSVGILTPMTQPSSLESLVLVKDVPQTTGSLLNTVFPVIWPRTEPSWKETNLSSSSMNCKALISSQTRTSPVPRLISA